MKSNNKTRYLILGLLSEESLSGYEIKKIVDLRFSYFWSESYGQIYPELGRMSDEGVIKKLESTESAGKRNSCKYEITPKGMQQLKDWLARPVEKEVIRYELLLKLYFSNLTDKETIIEQIREFQINHQKQQQMFKLFQEDLEKNLELHENHQRVLMVLLFGQMVWGAYDEWCQQVIDLLSEQNNSYKGDKNEQNN